MKLLKLARPQFLIAGILLYGFGALWAVLLGAPLDLTRLLLGYLIMAPAHLSVSFSNDYFDTEVDSYGTPTPFTGGSGILVRYPELRPTAKRIAIGLILCSLALGVLFMTRYPMPAWFLGLVIAGGLAGWFYSAPPLSLAYRGLGEITNAVVGGVLVPALAYVAMTETLTRDAFRFAVPVMLWGLAFIVAVEIPDVEADRLGGKRTFVARQGRKAGFAAVGVFLVAATGYVCALQWLRGGAYPMDLRALILFSCLPLAVGGYGALRRPVEQIPATRIVTLFITSLILFFILTDGYMIYQVWTEFTG